MAGRKRKRRARGARRAEPGAAVPWSRRSLLGMLVAYGIFYLLPAGYAMRFLLRLSGSALWMPSQWRVLTLILSLAIGMTCFGLGRLAYHRYTSGPDPVRVRAQAEAAGLRRALFWFLLALLPVAAHVGLRVRYVVPWHPDAIQVERAYGGGDSESPVDLSRVEAPAQLSFVNGQYSGSILVPPERLLPAEVEAAVAHHDGSVDVLITSEPFRFIVLIRRSQGLMLLTLAFLGLHLAIVMCTSLGYGHAFSLGEEVLGDLPWMT